MVSNEVRLMYSNSYLQLASKHKNNIKAITLQSNLTSYIQANSPSPHNHKFNLHSVSCFEYDSMHQSTRESSETDKKHSPHQPRMTFRISSVHARRRPSFIGEHIRQSAHVSLAS